MTTHILSGMKNKSIYGFSIVLTLGLIISTYSGCKKEIPTIENDEIPLILLEEVPKSAKVNQEMTFKVVIEPNLKEESYDKTINGKIIDGDIFYNIDFQYENSIADIDIIDHSTIFTNESYSVNGVNWRHLSSYTASTYGVCWNAKITKPGTYNFNLHITNLIKTVTKTYSVTITSDLNIIINKTEFNLSDSINTGVFSVTNLENSMINIYLQGEDKLFSGFANLTLYKNETKNVYFTLRREIAHSGHNQKKILINAVNDFTDSINTIKVIKISFDIPDSARISIINYNPNFSVFYYNTITSDLPYITVSKKGLGTAEYRIKKSSDLILCDTIGDLTQASSNPYISLRINTNKLTNTGIGGIIFDSLTFVINHTDEYKYYFKIFNYLIYKNICSGEILPDAKAYNKIAGIHPIIIQDKNKLIPEEWNPKSLGEAELVACLNSSSKLIETCNYTGNRKVYRNQLSYTVDLKEIKTGRTISSFKVDGPLPASCPPSSIFGSNEYVKVIDGVLPDFDNIIKGLRNFVVIN